MRDDAAIGVLHRPDGTTECLQKGDRWIMRIDPAGDLFELDPEVVIEGDPSYGFRLTAPFTTAEVRTVTTSQIICSSQGWKVDQHAMLTRAFETGERRFKLTDFLPGWPLSREG